MVRLSEDKELVLKAFAYFDLGAPVDSVECYLGGSDMKGNRTIERLYTVFNGFKKGKTNRELSDKEWSEDKIAGLHVWWEDFLRSKTGDSRNFHCQGIFDYSQKLRNRIVDPELYKRDLRGSTWDWGGFNWRLTPFLWLRVVTPYLDKNGKHFGLSFHELMAHLPTNKLMSHFGQLMEVIRGLNMQSEAKIKALKSNDPEWFNRWDRFEDVYLDAAFEEIEPGGFSIPEILPSIDRTFMTESAKHLLADSNESASKFDDAEALLQDMWNDLDPDTIRADIWLGHCERCSSLV